MLTWQNGLLLLLATVAWGFVFCRRAAACGDDSDDGGDAATKATGSVSSPDALEADALGAAVYDREFFHRRLFDASRVPIVVMDVATYRYLDCNPAAVEIYQLVSRENVLGKTPLDVSAPTQYDGTPSPAKARFFIEKALAEGTTVFEWRHQRPNGELWDGEVHLMSFQSGDRRLLQFTLQDITERKRAEQQLRMYVNDSERFTRIAAGRERRIIELKQAANELLRELGRPPRYTFAENGPGEGGALTEANAPRGGGADDQKESSSYELDEILDLESMQLLLNSFCDAVGNAAAIIDLEGRVFVGARWQRLCTDFHRINPETCARCIESDTILATHLREGQRFSIYQCRNGLTDAASPIIIDGRHIANVFVGQFLLDPPDKVFFRTQCNEHGFEENAYFEALREVSIIPKEKLPGILGFLTSFASLLGEMGLDHIRGRISEKRLARQAEELQSLVAELRAERRAALSLAEDANEGRIAAEQARESLAESEGRLRDIIFSMGDWVWEVDENGVYTYSSEKGFELFGPRREDVIGKSVLELLSPEQVPRIEPIFRECARTKAPIRDLENWNIARTGEKLCLLTNAVPILDKDGRLTGYRGVDKDITERKRAEEEKARLESRLEQADRIESVGRLAGGVAHDFNNMLGVILGHIDLALKEAELSERASGHLKEIQSAARRSADLTRQLLAFARRQAVVPKVLDLNETVAGMLKMLQRLIGEDIQLKWRGDPQLWQVKVDPSQIDQILANLCVNARDAIKGGGVISIETGNSTFDEAYCAYHPGFEKGEYARLVVSDNGRGMDKEVLPHIFEPFFTTKEVGHGTGLGLATVYGAVKQNNGFINVYSEPGQGTTFTIYLPRHKGEEGTAEEGDDLGGVPRGDETLLLVEDEPAVLAMTKAMLEGQGYRVLAVVNPEEALRVASRHEGKIHGLVTDVVMPGMNGRDLAKNLQVLFPAIKHLFMSGYTADVIAHQGVLDEGVCFIQKPFSMSDLASKVRELLDGR